MEIVRKEYSFKSATGLCDIYARSWAPADKDSVKAIFQITHGMAEHGERYARFAKKLCEHGYAVFAQDHIGHGKSVASDDDLGYFGEKDGWRDFVIDCRSAYRYRPRGVSRQARRILRSQYGLVHRKKLYR